MSFIADAVIIGAGPAGLTAAHELARRGRKPLVIEKADRVGGLARTETHKGFRFDIGGHRFYTKVPEVNRLWHEMLGKDFLKVRRLSRIYYKGKFFAYPLEPFNAFSNLGPMESARILMSYLKVLARRPYAEENTFEEWVTNRFGRRLYQTFFKTYTEKVWGIPCHRIQADWAAQRIKGLSLKAAVADAFFGSAKAKSLVKEFHYPRLGPGMMWERFQKDVERRGGLVLLGTAVTRIRREGTRVREVVARRAGGSVSWGAETFVSSMPLSHLIKALDPPPPEEVLRAAGRLSYRAFILVALFVNREKLFPDNWIYVHSPEAKVGRIQNFKNWSLEMVPDPKKTSLGMEYFCDEGDELWSRSDRDLIELARKEAAELGLAEASEVEDGTVVRQPGAYPVYDPEYRKNLDVIRGFLSTIENLVTIGRNGMHRYNNQDHSMLTAIRAVENLEGADHDLWSVNTERSYGEEFETAPGKQGKKG